jgi:photosynthetic reaction center cytochrome c subunit
MTPRLRIFLGSLAALVVVIAATGFQVQDYPVFTKDRPRGPKKIVQRKVYMDYSDQQIRAEMKRMAAEIGAKCDYCHNTKDYASFEKPTKEFAQYKLKMVEWLNAKYRPPDAKWGYSCYTCHRGQLKDLPSMPPGFGGQPGH